jgi:hypothetical protein
MKLRDVIALALFLMLGVTWISGSIAIAVLNSRGPASDVALILVIWWLAFIGSWDVMKWHSGA